jgi:hypothetical protein
MALYWETAMSTTAKGDAFEKLVFTAIKRELENGRLGLSPSACQIYRKKGYYSKERDADIIVDISIEITRPGATTFSMLWVCECKDYSGSVPVNDVEEFNDKLRQIGGKSVKGVIAIGRGGLQRGAFNIARANKIGVVRILPEQQVKWVMENIRLGVLNSGFNESDFLDAIMLPQFEGTNRDFYGVVDNYLVGDWHSVLKRMLETA